MKVLLRADVKGVGRRGDVVSVSAGHARNFLLPNDLAIVATDATVAQAEAMRKSREAKVAADRESAREVAASLGSRTITIRAKAGPEGRLYGSVGAADVAAAVAEQAGVSIDRKHVALDEPLRELGTHQVSAELFDGVTCTLSVSIVAG
ncbi:MAG: 50S ribosomal protein L9 [Acidimicrobiia bacterium]